MRELDLMLQRYLSQSYAAAEPAERLAFESLLELSDDALWHLLSSDAPPEDAELAALIRKLRSHPAPQP
jgi:succinate dehydrogenase flavin-adding protein (antitoxin of CptAB toxin-antitoxin module)